jgi:glycosyltransferase involved in cell wall biosynthesis
LLGAFERDMALRADASLLVSEAEADLFRKRTGAGNVMALGNGIDTQYYDPTAKFKKLHPGFPDPLIVFTGQMDYRPNIEAVTDFATHAMPIIRVKHPEASFAIVGRNPTQVVSDLSMLPDVRTWLAAADVVVAPLRIARGIQNKVLEAMAMARPVVASPAAAEGIDAKAESHFNVEPTVVAEAERVCALLDQPQAALKTGIAARAHVVRYYGWESQLAPLDDLMGYQPASAEAAE